MCRLQKERDDREARERAETREFYGEQALRKLRDADNKLLTHAAALLEEAKRHNRPDLAIRKGIDVSNTSYVNFLKTCEFLRKFVQVTSLRVFGKLRGVSRGLNSQSYCL